MEPSPRNAIQIVEQQVRKWALEKQSQERHEEATDYWPVVTVSREYGSLGATLGSMVAERLRFDFWDQELVHAIAEESGAYEPLVASLDENRRNMLEDFVDCALLGPTYTNSEYLRQLLRVIHTVAQHGRAVVVGRGSQFILENAEALRVRAVGPVALRTEGVAVRQSISMKEARARAERRDRERATFIRHHFKRDIADPSSYDLVINTSTLTLQRAAEIVVAAYRIKFAELPREHAPAILKAS